MDDETFNMFVVWGYVMLLPFLIALGTVVYPILVAIWIKEYIDRRM